MTLTGDSYWSAIPSVCHVLFIRTPLRKNLVFPICCLSSEFKELSGLAVSSCAMANLFTITEASLTFI